MCFVKSSKTLYVADRDIHCYKLVEKTRNLLAWRSQVMDFTYRIGKEYKKSEQSFRNFANNGGYTGSSEGFHSFTTLSRAWSDAWIGNKSATAILCVIPKGSLFMMNHEQKEYFSQAIIPLREMSRTDKPMYEGIVLR